MILVHVEGTIYKYQKILWCSNIVTGAWATRDSTFPRLRIAI